MEIEIVIQSKSYCKEDRANIVFDRLNLLINSGEFVSIIGPNGSGKTTLFNMIVGIDQDYDGYINIRSVSRTSEINKIEYKTSYMMQKDFLLPWLTVRSNILLGLEIQKSQKLQPAVIEQVREYLKQFDIMHLENTYPSKLSGGERQKIALIRTLMLDTPILLLDEPFSSVDYQTRLLLQTQLSNIAREKAKTVLLITHDLDEAITMSDRILVFGKRPKGVINDMPIVFDDLVRNAAVIKQDTRYALYFSQLWGTITDELSNEEL